MYRHFSRKRRQNKMKEKKYNNIYKHCKYRKLIYVVVSLIKHCISFSSVILSSYLSFKNKMRTKNNKNMLYIISIPY